MSTLSTHSAFRRYTRAQYRFDPPCLSTDPNDAVSRYELPDDPFTAANSIIKHYEDAEENCKDVRQALIDCMNHLELNALETDLLTCVFTMKTKYDINVRIIEADGNGPPKIEVDRPHNDVPRAVMAACGCLNEAVRLCFEFVNDQERHDSTNEYLKYVKRFRNKAIYMQDSIVILQSCKTFIDSFKEQAEFFLIDFSHAEHWSNTY